MGRYRVWAMQHHFVVYGVEHADGRITFDVEEHPPFADGPIYEVPDEGGPGRWRKLASDEDHERDTRILEALRERLV